jgi:hypothetical protein
MIISGVFAIVKSSYYIVFSNHPFTEPLVRPETRDFLINRNNTIIGIITIVAVAINEFQFTLYLPIDLYIITVMGSFSPSDRKVMDAIKSPQADINAKDAQAKIPG